MSGGHFDYIQYEINQITEELKHLVRSNNEGEWPNDFPDDILDAIAFTAQLSDAVSSMVQRIDYLVSGDDGEESFRERWAEEGLPKVTDEIRYIPRRKSK